MSRRAEYHVFHRFAVTNQQVEDVRSACSPSEKFVTVKVGSTLESLRIYTFKGVPGKHVDLLLPDSFREGDYVCEIGQKIGSFDGAKRCRLTFRWWPTPSNDNERASLKYPGPGKIVLEDDVDQLAVVCLFKPEGMWAMNFPRLRFRLNSDSDLRGVFLWQAFHYYKFLPEEDVRQAAEVWSLLPHIKLCEDIVVLNRTASQALYELARQLGWRKLTLREKRKIGLSNDAAQWQRIDGIALRNTKYANGAGQYSNEAARGVLPMYTETIQTSYGKSVVE